MIRQSPDDGLRALFRHHLPMVQWTTVETGATQSGVPDIEGCYNIAQFWVECKATRAYAIKFTSPHQIGWHLRRAREGGISFIAVRRRRAASARCKACDDLHIYSGRMARELSISGLRVQAGRLGMWENGPSNWDWGAILAVLMRA